jgi:hypothetical protein
MIDRINSFWSDFHDIPEHDQQRAFLIHASRIIDGVSDGSLRLREAGALLAPAWGYDALIESPEMTVAILLARHLSSWGYDDLTEAKDDWDQLVLIFRNHIPAKAAF